MGPATILKEARVRCARQVYLEGEWTEDGIEPHEFVKQFGYYIFKRCAQLYLMLSMI